MNVSEVGGVGKVRIFVSRLSPVVVVTDKRVACFILHFDATSI